jgi:gluconolactonase
MRAAARARARSCRPRARCRAGAGLLLALAGCAAPPLALEGPRVVADGFAFTEGPAADGRGALYFTDQPSDRILRLDSDGRVTTFLGPAGRANGLAFAPDGRLLACADERGELLAIDTDTRAVRVLAAGFGGRRFNGPNDLWVGPDGGVWFTDPFYPRPWWSHDAPELEGQHVYHLAPDGTVTVAARGFMRPNGVVGRADGSVLVVADIGAGRTWAFPILGSGRLGERRLVVEQGSDGLALDDADRVYLTGEGLTVVELATGGVVARVDTGGRRTSNAAFSGSTLYVTAGDALLALETNARDGSR